MKTKIQRCITLVLFIALCMGLSVIAMAANTTGIQLSLDTTEATVGNIPATITMSVSTSENTVPVSIWGKAYVSDGTTNGIAIESINDGDKELSSSNINTGRFAWMKANNTSSFSKWAEIVFALPSDLPAGTYTLGVTEMGAKDSKEDNLLSETSKTVTFTVNEARLSSISVKIAPSKTDYIEGQNFDPADMVIEATYTNNSTAVVSGWTVTDGTSLTTGKTYVTISYTEDGVTKTVTQPITVVKKEVVSISVKTKPSTLVYTDGDSFNPGGMVITVTYNDGTTKDITSGFTVSPDRPLTPDDKSVTIGYEGKTVNVNVTVNPIRVTGVILNNTSVTLMVGGSVQLNAKVTPDNATYKKVIWKSTNDSVASITDDGKVLAKKAGTALITVTSEDGSFKAVCEVTVKDYIIAPIFDDTEYTLTFDTNGGSAIDAVKEGKGSTINLQFYVPVKENFIFDGWYSDNALTKSIDRIVLSGNKTVYAKWKVVEITPDDKDEPVFPFTDVHTSDWSYNDIYYAWENNLMNGVSAATFSPKGTTTRAMIVTILWRLEGEKTTNYSMTFKDVEADQWYTEAIRWAASENIVTGYSEEKFGPEDLITREQLAAIIYRYAKYKGYDTETDPETNFLSFNDVFDISEYAKQPMFWALKNEIINGSNNNLNPQGYATREQVAAILHRFCDKFVK